MATPNQPKRVALMSEYPAGLEDDVISGVLDYVDHSPQWQFVGFGHRPFRPFHEIDLREVDGVIGAFYFKSWAKAVADAGIAAVDTWADFEHQDLPRITNNDLITGRLGAEHLLERGVTEFGFVTATGLWNLSQRRAGFERVLQAANRSCDVLSVDLEPTPIEQRVHACRQWLARLPKPIGIMAATDYLAVYVVDAAAQLGLSIPDDVAVVGVGDDRWASAVAATPLSSVQLNMRQVGYRAARLLEALMKGGACPRVADVPPVAVVSRRSTEIVVSDDDLVSQALRYIRNYVADEINVEDVLHEIGVSRATLVKRMKQCTGYTPSEAITRARIAKAKELLLATDMKMEEIAVQCGFRCHPRLQETFKRMTSLTPGQFRKQARRG